MQAWNNHIHIKGVQHPWALFFEDFVHFLKKKKKKQLWTKYLQGTKKSQFHFSRDIVVKLQWKMCENQLFPCFEP